MADESTLDSTTERETPVEEESDPGATRAAAPDRPVFQHQQWMVGVVLIFAVVAIVAGLGNPVWWLIGSPCILTLAVYLWVRVARRA